MKIIGLGVLRAFWTSHSRPTHRSNNFSVIFQEIFQGQVDYWTGNFSGTGWLLNWNFSGTGWLLNWATTLNFSGTGWLLNWATTLVDLFRGFQFFRDRLIIELSDNTCRSFPRFPKFFRDKNFLGTGWLLNWATTLVDLFRGFHESWNQVAELTGNRLLQPVISGYGCTQ